MIQIMSCRIRSRRRIVLEILSMHELVFAFPLVEQRLKYGACCVDFGVNNELFSQAMSGLAESVILHQGLSALL